MNAQPEAAWLMFSCVVPCADGVGIEKRAWAHLSAMSTSRRPRLVLALTAAQLSRLPSLEALAELCEAVHVLPIEPSARGRPLSNSVALLAQRVLLWGRGRWQASEKSLEALRSVVGGPRLDRVFCFRLVCFELWCWLERQCGYRASQLVVDFDDIESLALQRALEVEGASRGRALRIASRLALGELSRLEAIALQSATVLVCSSVDQARLLQRLPSARVEVVPNGYEVREMLAPPRPDEVLKLLFLGTLSYPPNIDAAQQLVDTLLPELRRAWPGQIEVRVVGRRPTAQVLALHRPPEVQVWPDVDDITEAYADADVVVVPIRFGGGTRIKILEALALGRPVVTTPIGVEGLELQHERDLLIADSPEQFALACVRIAHDASLAAQLIREGRNTFLGLYSDEGIRRRTAELLSRPQVAVSTR